MKRLSNDSLFYYVKVVEQAVKFQCFFAKLSQNLTACFIQYLLNLS
ncbi:hypothetical protein CYK57_02012 [Actinobacillus pleuropneumoniae]|uniref:Uncharacterized protein n=1 Tax=Actinobacillus pleuropneumoniae serovar 6 str. Femo TaxID=754256 RepID=A0A828PSF3_ACTPL|nr:hypothetical protein appser2_17920 [Actinobacillus pleuropneumoniae serovar 2 str. S1536]EFM89015.1 hypothetical protein appser4_18150 [Actinobacillus pleuropneumoniae serovar 4 str. M62]EFM91160.1 hypothetical protein appser6_19330 [Actinobacillus pleuropneumoniae serovar 6 str. Femo]EFM93336.1 hypothetical protein appser9_18930 [Actinobacillus pleuropneumoniae serovar 9 str. CVJ13261]EFM95684.1 hypothetical protein appser10_18370 [Actinobacillus pleuropneumoniae serovar 10 str. D13039]EFM